MNKPRVRNDDIDKETANAEKHPEMYREDNYYSDEEPEVNPWEKVYVQYITVKLIEAEKCKKLVETVFKRPYELGMICAISLDGYFESVNIFILSFAVIFLFFEIRDPYNFFYV